MKPNEPIHVANQFAITGKITSIAPFGGGHINDTFLLETDQKIRYILQKINKNVFKEPLHVVNNIEKLLNHFIGIGQDSLKTFPAKDGENYVLDSSEDYWRMYNFVDGTITFDVIQNNEQAFEAARAFGTFQMNTLELNATDFYETIPNFHHLGKRYEKFDLVREENPKNRVELVKEEIKFALEHRKIADITLNFIATGKLPVRVTHNDAKLNNVLLNAQTGKGVCVIDLDTVMPGLVMYDFGDMARSFASPVAEDDNDYSKVQFRKEIFESLTRGYLSVLSDILSTTEKENLLLGAKYMTLIMGLRFLTDYIEGDVYYKTNYDDHNLVRAKNQFALLKSIEDQEVELQEIILANV